MAAAPTRQRRRSGGLSDAEEQSLGRLARSGDRPARDRLTEANQGLVGMVVRKLHYERTGLEAADLFQEGAIALLRAATRWDPDRGLRFGTYAVWVVRRHLWKLIQVAASKHAWQYPILDESTGEAWEPPDRTPEREADESCLDGLPLTQTERMVFRLRFGLDGRRPMKLKAVARHVGLSTSRVHQTVTKGLAAMRQAA